MNRKRTILKRIGTGDECWFHYSYSSSKRSARSSPDIILRTRQAIGTKRTLRTIFFTGRKLTVLDVLPKGSKFNQLYFVDYIFPNLKKRKRELHRWIPQPIFWVRLDNSICHGGSRAASKFEKHHVSRLPQPLYSPGVRGSLSLNSPSLCSFMLHLTCKQQDLSIRLKHFPAWFIVLKSCQVLNAVKDPD
jgi:hypothetical protein